MTASGAAYGSDLLVDLLMEVGIDHVALSPGATFRGLHDSLVNYRGDAAEDRPVHPRGDLGRDQSRVRQGLRSSDGGRAPRSCRPPARVHGRCYNAWCDRVPMLLLGGAAPVEPARRRPWIDAVHSADLQALQIRDYTKWQVQPPSIAALPAALYQAMSITNTAPCGPVYVCVDEDVQEAPTRHAHVRGRLRRYAPPPPLAPDRESVDTLAEWLLSAQRPVVVVEVVGRDPDAFAMLIDLAELVALPVVEIEREYNRPSLNIATTHPLNLSGSGPELLAEADLVVGLAVRDAAMLTAPFGDGARPRLVLASTQDVVKRGWANDVGTIVPCDLRIISDPGPLLAALLDRPRRRRAGRRPSQRARRAARGALGGEP